MKQFLLFFLCISFNFVGLADNQSAMTVSSQVAKQEKMPVLLGVVGKNNEEVLPVSGFLKSILRCDQYKTVGFLATEQQFERTPNKWAIKKLYPRYPLALFLSLSRDGQTLEWRLYDTQKATMVKGQRFARKDYSARLQAEHLADELWPTLTGQPGFFSTRIAFCKEVPNKKVRGLKQVCLVSPYANPSQQQQYASFRDELMHGKLFAPRWNKDVNQPMVLYSESTLSNVRLMSVDLQRKRKVVSNFEGLNVLPTFSTDGKRVVYCLSHNGRSQLYLYEFDAEKKASLKRLTRNKGNNISPVLCDNGDIIFCSDSNSRGPQICYFHADTKTIDRLTSGGYCACPSLCIQNNKLAYCKSVEGVMQVFLYDMHTKQHEQVTFDFSNKEECSWSPCGTYLAFTADNGKSSRIAVLNLLTKERAFITPANERCIYPSWSPRYQVPLIVT